MSGLSVPRLPFYFIFSDELMVSCHGFYVFLMGEKNPTNQKDQKKPQTNKKNKQSTLEKSLF